MISPSDQEALRTKLRDKLKEMPRAQFAAQHSILLSKLNSFLAGESISEPTYRKLLKAVDPAPAPQPELFPPLTTDLDDVEKLLIVGSLVNSLPDAEKAHRIIRKLFPHLHL